MNIHRAPRGVPRPRERGRAIATVRLIGIGRPKQGDDGIGLAVATHLSGSLPVGVESRLFDGDGLGLFSRIEGSDAVVIVGAVAGAGVPGSIFRWELSRISAAALPGARVRFNGRSVGIVETLGLCRLVVGPPKPAILFGMEGLDFESRTDLSSAVRHNLPILIQAVRDELDTIVTVVGQTR